MCRHQMAFRLHGSPLSIVLDRDTLFIGEFWQELCRILGTRLRMSFAWHPATGGQTERAVRSLEEMLRTFTAERQENWDELLCTSEFAYNNAVHGTAKFTPFFLNYHRHPHTPAVLASQAPLPLGGETEAEAMVQEYRQALQDVRAHIAAAKKIQAECANKSRKEHVFQVGDKVWVETKFLKAAQTGTKRKLDPAWSGPFDVVEVVSRNAYRIGGYPAHWRIHSVINVSRLRLHVTAEQFPGRSAPGGAEVEVAPDQRPLWSRVVKFLARRRDPEDRRIWQNLVRWEDWEDTWETELEMRECCMAATGSLEQFNTLYAAMI